MSISLLAGPFPAETIYQAKKWLHHPIKNRSDFEKGPPVIPAIQ